MWYNKGVAKPASRDLLYTIIHVIHDITRCVRRLGVKPLIEDEVQNLSSSELNPLANLLVSCVPVSQLIAIIRNCHVQFKGDVQ